jgi:hypothetical protein
MWQLTRGVVLVVLCLHVLGCGQQIMTPMAAEALAPPPDLLGEVTTTRQSISSPAQRANFDPSSGSLDGSYRGYGRLVRNPGGTCQTGMPVYGMQVAGDRVHFGSFNGTIQSNGVGGDGLGTELGDRAFRRSAFRRALDRSGLLLRADSQPGGLGACEAELPQISFGH